MRRLLVAALLWLATPGATVAQAQDCGTPLLRVEHVHAVDLAHACAAWQRIAGFLLDVHGMRLAAPVTVAFAEVVEFDLGPVRLRVLGLNDRAARTIRVTSMTAAWLREPDRLMFRHPVTEELHISLIAHELAHAVMKDSYAPGVPPNLVCDEYIAYVAQLATMEPATRERVLALYAPGDFATREEITQICLMMAPHEFGVRAWRHYQREGHRDMFRDILSGRFRAEEYPF